MRTPTAPPLAPWLLVLSLLGACGGDNAQEAGDAGAAARESSEESLPADFVAFYERFHRDTAFQLSRVTFPLEGRVLTDTATGQAVEGRFERGDWVAHQPFELGPDFTRETALIEEGLVFETIRARAGNYSIERRFARQSGEWNLIYYRESTF